MITIKQVKKTKLYDVFSGNGWKNHTRVFVKDKHVQFKSGKKLSKIEYVEIVKSIGVN